MTDLEKTIDDLKLLNALCHGTVLDDAIALLKGLQDEIDRSRSFLKDQEAQKQSILKNIADNQLANSPDEWQSPEQQMYSKGVFDGLQIAYEMLAYGVVKNDA